MSSSLFSAVSGLRNNQEWLDVIGNNIANSNTPGFKASQVVFQDILSQTLKPASGPTSRLGGTNPLQLGRGSVISSIDQNFAQGSLLTTGRTLDLGVQAMTLLVAVQQLHDVVARHRLQQQLVSGVQQLLDRLQVALRHVQHAGKVGMQRADLLQEVTDVHDGRVDLENAELYGPRTK